MSDADDLLATLQKQMQDFAKQMEQAKTDLAPIKDEIIKVNAAQHQLQQEYQVRMDELRHKKSDLMNNQTKAEQNVTSLQVQYNSLVNKAEQVKAQMEAEKKAKEAAEKEAKKYAALNQKFDQGTMGAPWREWAKDHQIAAGHKITLDRYVILADVMGLGKTLSSIVTADMAEAATKGASKEWPFLGEEKEVYVPPKEVWTKKAEEIAFLYAEEYAGGYGNDAYWPFSGPLSNGVSIVQVPLTDEATFEDKSVDPLSFSIMPHKLGLAFRNTPVIAGNSMAYIPYDLKNKLKAEGFIEMTQAETKVEIVNSITRPVGRKILYFCPSPLLRNVLKEWRQWAPHRNVTYIGNMSKAQQDFVFMTIKELNQYVIIVNYEAWRRNKKLLDKLAECEFDTVIIDEAHMIKERKTSAYQGVKQVVDTCKPEYVIPMTGTPILNKPQELFSLLTLIDPQTFFHENDFLMKYCESYENDSGQTKWKFRPGGLETLAKRISKNFLRRTKDMAGVQLPEKTVIYHELDRDDENYPEQAKARQHMRKYATLIIDEAKGKALSAPVMIALITRLRQIETWPAGIIQRDKLTKEIILQVDIEESQKVDYIIRKDDNGDYEGLIPEVIEDERIVVFSQFKAPLHELRRRIELAGYRAVVLDGDTPQATKDQIAEDFDARYTPDRSKSKWDVVLCNYKVGGVGLNFTAASSLITLDDEWNPGKQEQALDRVHRIGQEKPVTINIVRTKDTIDTWLAEIIEDKKKIVDGFEGAMFSAADLKGAIESGLI